MMAHDRTTLDASGDNVDLEHPPRGRWNRSRGFMVTNHVTNPILVWVLDHRFGRRLGRSLAVVRYTGRISGIERRLVTQYRRNGSAVTIAVAAPERKQWWRNFSVPHPIELELEGCRYPGSASARAGADGTVSVTVALNCHGAS